MYQDTEAFCQSLFVSFFGSRKIRNVRFRIKKKIKKFWKINKLRENNDEIFEKNALR